MPTPPIRVPVKTQAIELGVLEMNTMVRYLGHVTMDFFTDDV